LTTYLVSLGIGLLVGVLYGFLGVRSPAPPLVALVGLLGILIGEQSVGFCKQHFQNRNVSDVKKE
jgi:XapX domain-containing protein